MEVRVYSRMAVGSLMKNGFPDNVSVVSFYNSSGMSDSGKNRVDYTKACDSVFYVCAPDIDENGFDEYGYTEDTFLSEADDLADFIYSAVSEGRDIICQCDFGRSRSAACAAAILDHFEERGYEIFSGDTYSPNPLVYKRVLEALVRREYNR